MIDVNKALKITLKKGKVIIGGRQTIKSINDGTAKLVILAKNSPKLDEIKKLSKKKEIPVFEYNSNSIDLGYACGRDFAVSVFTVIEDGGSNILQIVNKG